MDRSPCRKALAHNLDRSAAAHNLDHNAFVRSHGPRPVRAHRPVQKPRGKFGLRFLLRGCGTLRPLYDSGLRCFLQGTLIDTPDGQKKVEELLIGDLVTTIGGAARPLSGAEQRWSRGRSMSPFDPQQSFGARP